MNNKKVGRNLGTAFEVTKPISTFILFTPVTGGMTMAFSHQKKKKSAVVTYRWSKGLKRYQSTLQSCWDTTAVIVNTVIPLITKN